VIASVVVVCSILFTLGVTLVECSRDGSSGGDNVGFSCKGDTFDCNGCGCESKFVVVTVAIFNCCGKGMGAKGLFNFFFSVLVVGVIFLVGTRDEEGGDAVVVSCFLSMGVFFATLLLLSPISAANRGERGIDGVNATEDLSFLRERGSFSFFPVVHGSLAGTTGVVSDGANFFNGGDRAAAGGGLLDPPGLG